MLVLRAGLALKEVNKWVYPDISDLFLKSPLLKRHFNCSLSLRKMHALVNQCCPYLILPQLAAFKLLSSSTGEAGLSPYLLVSWLAVVYHLSL